MSIRVDTNSGENALYTSLVARFDDQTVRRQRLDVGDVVLTADSGTVLVERKSWADLAKSLTDKRYEEQKARMLSFVAGAGQDEDDDAEGADTASIAAVYIVEGALTGWHGKAVHMGGAPQMLNAQLEAAIVMMGVRDGITVLRSKDKAHTTELVSYLFHKLRAGELLAGADGGAAPRYAGLVAKKRKRDNLTPGTTWEVMLAQISGMSAHKAAAVAEAYPSMSALAGATATDLAAVMVQPKSGGGGKARRLGKAVAGRLAALA